MNFETILTDYDKRMGVPEFKGWQEREIENSIKNPQEYE